jgi:hypothetical protein
MVRLWSVDKGVLRDNCGSSPGHWPPSSSVVWPAGQTSGLSLTTTRPQVRALPRPPWPRSGALGVQPHGGEVGGRRSRGCTPAVDSGGPPERGVLPDQWDQGGVAHDPLVDLGPADPDVGDGAGPPVCPKNQEPKAPRGVDRQPPGPCRVGPERGDLGLWHVAVQRQVGLGVDRPLDGPVRDSQRDLDPVDPGLAQRVGGGIPIGVAVEHRQPSGDVGGRV